MKGDLNTLIQSFTTVIESLVPIVIGLAILLFLYGLLKYIVSKDEAKRKEAVSVITMGIVVIFVMVSVWGLVRIIASIFDTSVYSPDSSQTLQKNTVDVDTLIPNN